jgi:YhcH/YjgK/YiaL family protein
MAIFGPFPTVRDQLATDARFRAAFDYVASILRANSAERRRLGGMTEGASEKHELAGGAFAIDQVYRTRGRPDCFFESHRRYIDVQVVVEGAEVMEVADIAGLTVGQEYDPERDFIKYTDCIGASGLRLRAGDLAVFFPSDGHMPCLQPDGRAGLVRKTVVKVPVA